MPGVDIVHDVTVFPWPLPDECVLKAIASHLVEHIPPAAIGPDGMWWPFMAFMDEVWRVMKPYGEFIIVAPHGSSQGFLQDPTHCNALNENTFYYFTPGQPLNRPGYLYNFYKPRPWRIKEHGRFFNPAGNIEIVLVKEGGTEDEADQV
jgi:SAM-dependent methyltransferase